MTDGISSINRAVIFSPLSPTKLTKRWPKLYQTKVINDKNKNAASNSQGG